MLKKLLSSLFILFLPFSSIYSQSEQLTIRIPSSALPGMLSFENPKGSIRVTGYDGTVMVVTGIPRFTGTASQSGEMHRIGKSDFNISAEADGKNITLMCTASGKTVDFDIKLPANFSMKLKSLDNGDINIVNVRGEVDAENANGDITLENISGSAVLSSVYGKIKAIFTEVSEGEPMMFTSLEGDIMIALPESTNARLKMKSEKGDIFSDFDIKPGRRQPIVKNVENSTIYSLEDWVVGTLNRGGAEYILKSYNGNITIRKR